MPQIRPVSDLRNHFAEISQTVHETNNPVILTKNGYGDMVVMSYAQYERVRHQMMVTQELQAAALETETTDVRYSHEDVMQSIRAQIKAAGAHV